MTPCNASPNLSALMSFRPIVRDDAEEAWKNQILSLFSHMPTSPLELFQLLNKLVKVSSRIVPQNVCIKILICFLVKQDVVNKTIAMTKDSCTQLSSRNVPLLTSRLKTLSDLLCTRADPPHVWFTVDALQEPRFSETLRFGMLEIQEHLETFLDRKDHAAEVIF